ncbi:hypothetical protein UFOVP116_294 [uncultured Caudovirales phage]|uniref:Uncharacterized protein n=1 Tax=uncultured Caudovirales phage TaxID=2100421 RepID=A0A6J5LET0_9CAUD|nr:hypothetical protein UFOVP116_294 [uncultured Caudovirales phage]
MQQDLNNRHLAIWKHPDLCSYFVAAKTKMEAAAVVYSAQLKRLDLSLFEPVQGKLFAGKPQIIRKTLGDIAF